MASIYAGDVEPTTMCVTTAKERSTSIVGTLSKCFQARTTTASFDLPFSQSSSPRDPEQTAQDRVRNIVRIRPDGQQSAGLVSAESGR